MLNENELPNDDENESFNEEELFKLLNSNEYSEKIAYEFISLNEEDWMYAGYFAEEDSFIFLN